MGVPVDQAFAAIDQALVVHIDKDLDDGVVEVAILTSRRTGRAGHGKGFAVPIGAGAQTLQLANNRAAGFDLLIPNARQELVPPHITARRLAILRHLALGHHLRGNARMVGAGLPKGVIPLHPVPAHQNILQRVVEGMAHVQAAGDIRRRDHHGKGRMPRLGIGPGGKGLGVQPKL